jgi:hypothetical protein
MENSKPLILAAAMIKILVITVMITKYRIISARHLRTTIFDDLQHNHMNSSIENMKNIIHESNAITLRNSAIDNKNINSRYLFTGQYDAYSKNGTMLEVNNRQRNLCDVVQWVHVPKTASSLCLTVRNVLTTFQSMHFSCTCQLIVPFLIHFYSK